MWGRDAYKLELLYHFYGILSRLKNVLNIYRENEECAMFHFPIDNKFIFQLEVKT